MRVAEADSGRRRVPPRTPLLLALTAGPAAAEAAILAVLGDRAAVGRAAQVTAPSPFGVFHDLRWVFVYHDSWLAFAAELLGAVAVRTLLGVAIVVLVWPAERSRPPMRRLVRTNLVVTVVSAVALAPWTAVTVAAGVTALSWFAIGAMLAVLVLAPVLHRGPMTGAWWRGLPPPASVLWVVVTFAALTGTAVLVELAPGWARVPVATAAGALNAPLWRALVRSAVLDGSWLPRVPTVPVALVLLLAALAGSGVLARSGSAGAGRPPPPLLLRDGARPEHTVVYVGGYDSRYDGNTGYATDPAGRYPMPVQRFSYAGLDDSGRPRPYTAADTHQPLTRSAELLAAQVAEVHRRTGRPVALLGHSEGSLVVRTYLARHPYSGVEAVALLSPLPQPARVYYPPGDARTGWGIATGWQLRIIFAAVARSGGAGISTDDAFVRSLLDAGPRYHYRMLCPVPGVRMIAFLPLLDAITDPPGPEPRIPVVVVPERHAMDYGRAVTQRRLVAFLRGEPPDPTGYRGYRLLRAAGSAWQAPSLSPGLNPRWRDAGLDGGCGPAAAG